MPRPDPRHQQTARWHAIVRARERFGIDLGMSDIVAAEALMREGKFPIIEVRHTGPIFLAELEGRPCRVVWKHDLDCIVTLLPVSDERIEEAYP